MSLPSIAIVGAPNVGKSRLFNRLAGGRSSLVHSRPGVTRDRIEARVDLDGRPALLVDTGGLLLDPQADLARQIERQALEAAQEADLVLFVVDLKAGITNLDRELGRRLRRLDRPILLALNKVDALRRAEENRAEVWDLGLGEGIEVSAEHAIGIAELREAIAARLPEGPQEEEEQPEAIPVAVVGRPNAGKSSLFNRLLRRERAIVSPIPGTTHDRVQGAFVHLGRKYLLVDTAGLRRGARVSDPLEALTAAVARGTVGKAAIVLLVVDGQRGIDRQDLAVAGLALRTYRPLIIVLNKVDLLTPTAVRALRQQAEQEFAFASYAPRLPVSALGGRGLGALKAGLQEVWDQGGRRVPTAALNKLLAKFRSLQTTTPRRRSVRLLYATQEGIHPPSFVVFGHTRGRVHFAYRRRLENFLRQRLELTRTPLVLRFRSG